MAEIISELGFEWRVLPFAMFGDQGHVLVQRVVLESALRRYDRLGRNTNSNHDNW